MWTWLYILGGQIDSWCEQGFTYQKFILRVSVNKALHTSSSYWPSVWTRLCTPAVHIDSQCEQGFAHQQFILTVSVNKALHTSNRRWQSVWTKLYLPAVEVDSQCEQGFTYQQYRLTFCPTTSRHECWSNASAISGESAYSGPIRWSLFVIQRRLQHKPAAINNSHLDLQNSSRLLFYHCKSSVPVQSAKCKFALPGRWPRYLYRHACRKFPSFTGFCLNSINYRKFMVGGGGANEWAGCFNMAHQNGKINDLTEQCLSSGHCRNGNLQWQPLLITVPAVAFFPPLICIHKQTIKNWVSHCWNGSSHCWTLFPQWPELKLRWWTQTLPRLYRIHEKNIHNYLWHFCGRQ